ncbi:MAG: hypothetical protein J6J24_03935 [Clostridia bacterium]|nr:hypothetical protein [Clostridia bacterium]
MNKNDMQHYYQMIDNMKENKTKLSPTTNNTATNKIKTSEEKATRMHEHSGHRQRLLETITQVGIEKVSEIQAVEFFLTYIFPRGDVNLHAHRLLDKFGCFANILEASEHDIAQVYGFNKRSAKKIVNFLNLTNYYVLSKLKRKINLNKREEFLSFLKSLLENDKTERLYIFAVNNRNFITQHRKFEMKSVHEVGITPESLINFITSARPTAIVLAHSHPNGSAVSSQEDKDAYQYIDTLIQQFNCRVYDSLIVGDDGIYSENQKAFVKTFKSEYDLFN